ncbi:SMI1/KNR4 family protein [Pedobacter paludis]|uniref:SMI1/KNR4 family protein n=1 Tax=Pedobacter paludis TaxID=2203212 RepID=A0A317F3A8_9SPHI|nr:SMI1/KNR4 family protein [Pedobacter paludis]PWS31978.1 SMI1/KNR4 family protein [Pedobacter paludis]
MTEIDKILQKYNWPKNEFVRNLNFQEIENKIEFELPEDYKQFLLKYPGYEIQLGEEYIKLWDYDKLLEWNEGYEIIQELRLTLGIGDNGGGEFIGLEKLINGHTRVVLTPFIDLNIENHIEIGSSFTDFLKRLDNGKTWFNEGKSQ